MILDVGCGFSRRHHERIRGVGVDVKKGTCDVQASAEQLPFRDGVFSFVHMRSLLEHLSRPIRALREAIRVATSKATFYISFPKDSSYERIHLKNAVYGFPFGTIGSLREYGKLLYPHYENMKHKSQISVASIHKLLDVKSVGVVYARHPWFCGRKGKFLERLFGRAVTVKWRGNIQILATKK